MTSPPLRTERTKEARSRGRTEKDTVGRVKRVLVIGCGGSGKTVISRAIASRLGLPLIHLDAEYYDPEWHPLEPELFAARQRQLVSGTQWVIEGNYAATLGIRLHAADTLVILNLPARTCILGSCDVG